MDQKALEEAITYELDGNDITPTQFLRFLIERISAEEGDRETEVLERLINLYSED